MVVEALRPPQILLQEADRTTLLPFMKKKRQFREWTHSPEDRVRASEGYSQALKLSGFFPRVVFAPLDLNTTLVTTFRTLPDVD